MAKEPTPEWLEEHGITREELKAHSTGPAYNPGLGQRSPMIDILTGKMEARPGSVAQGIRNRIEFAREDARILDTLFR